MAVSFSIRLRVKGFWQYIQRKFIRASEIDGVSIADFIFLPTLFKGEFSKFH